MFQSHAQIATPLAKRCLTRLCRHWGHKFAVSFDEQYGDIFFDPARCLLAVNEGGLLVTIQASDAAEVTELEPIVADHLQRMAADEVLLINWQR